MTTTTPALGRLRLHARTRTTPERWNQPLVWTAGALALGLGFTAIVSLTAWFPKGSHVGSSALELNTIDGGIALLVAYLSHGRFVREHRVRHRLIAHGLAVIGTAGIVPAPAVELLHIEAAGTPALWMGAVLRVVGTALLVAGALSGDRRVPRPRARGVGLAVPVALAVGILGAVAVLGPVLRPAILPLHPGEVGPLGFVSDPVFGAMLVLVAIGFAITAVALTGLATRHQGDPIALKGPAFALGAFALLQYALFPTLATDWVYTGDLLRTASYALLLLGAVLEIRRYWTGQSRVAVLADRRRLAREIHDGVVQEITYIRMESRSLPPLAGVDRIVDACDRALDEARDAVHALALADDEPLHHLLERAAHDLARRHRIDVDLRLPVTVPSPDADQRHGLVRIVREAIANAARHGRARTVTVTVERAEPGWSLVVHDDGVGFDLGEVTRTAGGYGLISMRERADALPGRCVVESGPGIGTTVKVMW